MIIVLLITRALALALLQPSLESETMWVVIVFYAEVTKASNSWAADWKTTDKCPDDDAW